MSLMKFQQQSIVKASNKKFTEVIQLIENQKIELNNNVRVVGQAAVNALEKTEVVEQKLLKETHTREKNQKSNILPAHTLIRLVTC